MRRTTECEECFDRDHDYEYFDASSGDMIGCSKCAKWYTVTSHYSDAWIICPHCGQKYEGSEGMKVLISPFHDVQQYLGCESCILTKEAEEDDWYEERWTDEEYLQDYADHLRDSRRDEEILEELRRMDEEDK